jgi:hypothetical protein
MTRDVSFALGGLGWLINGVITSCLGLSSFAGMLIHLAPGASAQAEPPFGPSIASPPSNKNIFFFTPWGSQLDVEDTSPIFHVPTSALNASKSHNIYDLLVAPNQPLNFEVYFYQTSPYFNDGDTFQGASLMFEYNNAEWRDTGFEPFFNLGLPLKNGPFANPFLYMRANGLTVNPGTAPDDGFSDFKVTLVRFYINSLNNELANVGGQFQDIDLQQGPSDPVSPVPTPLPALGLLTALGSLREARRYAAKLRADTSKQPRGDALS